MIPPDIRLGSVPADSARGDRRATNGEGWRDAWQKEMEQAQARGWLGHGVVGGASALAASAPASAARLIAGEAVRVAGPAAIDEARPQASPALPAPASTSAATDAHEPWTDGEPNAIWIHIIGKADAVEKHCGEARYGPEALVQAPTASAQAPEPKPKVRVHAEWTANGVRLWLGIDADAPVSLPSLLQQLQRCAAAVGMRLRSVTCNGRPVPLDQAAPSHRLL